MGGGGIAAASQNPKRGAKMKILMSIAALLVATLSTPALAANAACEKQADEKKLAGAARTSFVTKCEKDAGGAGGAACDKQADEKKLAGAARTSFTKKCVADAGG